VQSPARRTERRASGNAGSRTPGRTDLAAKGRVRKTAALARCGFRGNVPRSADLLWKKGERCGVGGSYNGEVSMVQRGDLADVESLGCGKD
jgi:hypothetical protein